MNKKNNNNCLNNVYCVVIEMTSGDSEIDAVYTDETIAEYAVKLIEKMKDNGDIKRVKSARVVETNLVEYIPPKGHQYCIECKCLIQIGDLKSGTSICDECVERIEKTGKSREFILDEGSP